MIRRRFLGMVAGAGGVAVLAKAGAAERQTAEIKVSGFTCVTCAVGLETMLLRERGVLRVKATYPEGRATVDFDPRRTSAAAIRAAIAEMGFHAETV